MARGPTCSQLKPFSGRNTAVDDRIDKRQRTNEHTRKQSRNDATSCLTATITDPLVKRIRFRWQRGDNKNAGLGSANDVEVDLKYVFPQVNALPQTSTSHFRQVRGSASRGGIEIQKIDRPRLGYQGGCHSLSRRPPRTPDTKKGYNVGGPIWPRAVLPPATAPGTLGVALATKIQAQRSRQVG